MVLIISDLLYGKIADQLQYLNPVELETVKPVAVRCTVNSGFFFFTNGGREGGPLFVFAYRGFLNSKLTISRIVRTRARRFRIGSVWVFLSVLFCAFCCLIARARTVREIFPVMTVWCF